MAGEENMTSVCYRTGRLTEADYDEAIKDLEQARQQERDRMAGRGAAFCAICEDGDHTAESCHHNPLVLARRMAAASGVWNCYHCGYVAYNDEEARAHFGNHDDEVVKCLKEKASVLSQDRAVSNEKLKMFYDELERRASESDRPQEAAVLRFYSLLHKAMIEWQEVELKGRFPAGPPPWILEAEISACACLLGSELVNFGKQADAPAVAIVFLDELKNQTQGTMELFDPVSH